MVKKDIKNDSDSEDEGKKTRQRFKSERPKEQHKIEKHEPSRLIRTSVLEALRRAVTKILRPGISPGYYEHEPGYFHYNQKNFLAVQPPG